jgi:hypothetical protein
MDWRFLHLLDILLSALFLLPWASDQLDLSLRSLNFQESPPFAV